MSASRFLPAGFDSSAPLLLIAGKGNYPKETLARARAAGIPVRLAAFEGETDADLYEAFAPGDRAMMNVGQLGRLIKSARNFGAKHAIMAGQITPGRLFRGLKPDLKALAVLATLRERNAETIFGAIASELAKAGCGLLDARSFLDDALAPAGFFSGSKWDVRPEHLAHGLKIARGCAELDIGQSCVVARGSVLAVEGFEGTDKMIERAGGFGARDALFVKTVKPRQDYRFDVPVVGERTVRKLAAAGIRNVAVEAGKVILLEPEKVAALARENGIRIFGA